MSTTLATLQLTKDGRRILWLDPKSAAKNFRGVYA